MRYDKIVIGETPHAQRTALSAARDNRLVAIVRTKPILESVFQTPLENWNWTGRPSWKSLRQQFHLREQSMRAEYARLGIDLVEGRPLAIHAREVTISSREGNLITLEAEQIENHPASEVLLPTWLQSEVPGVTPLPRIPRLEMLPESIMVEGNSLAALRFAVLCARLHRRVVVSSSGWNSPEFEFELAELEAEAAERGILRLDLSALLSVAERSSGEFDFWLLNGDIYRTELYVFATETPHRLKETSDPAAITAPSHLRLKEKFASSVF